MTRAARRLPAGAAGALIVAIACPVVGQERERLTQTQAAGVLRAWYMGMCALETSAEIVHSSPALTVELDPDTRLIVPPHLAKQEIIEIQRADLGSGLEDAVVVGVDARTKDDIPQAYALVFAHQQGVMALMAELPMREHVERIQHAWVNQREPLLVLHGASGSHFMDMFVYRFVGGQPELLFKNGSAADAEFRYDAKSPVPSIWIGVENWTDPNWDFASGDRRWNVYTWSGREFVYSERLSSVREMSIGERVSQYTIRTIQRVEENQKNETKEKISAAPRSKK